MKKLIQGLFLLFNLLIPTVFAGGGMVHMYIAEQVISLQKDAQLRDLLSKNRDAYLAGAYYPDSGYIQGTGYGEDSHWDAFIDTFADYIKEKYPNALLQHPKLIAFLMGCAVHRVSDEIIHWTFYTKMAAMDFKGHEESAHDYGDIGIDLMLNVDKLQWFKHPISWWIPVQDLLNVYHRMGKNEYTAQQIIWGNSIIYIAGYGERIIALPAYPYLQIKMPWTAKHYMDSPDGGIQVDEQLVADYQMKLWDRLINNKNPNAMLALRRKYNEKTTNLPLITFAKAILENKAMKVPATTDAEGNVVLASPVITNNEKYTGLLQDLANKIAS